MFLFPFLFCLLILGKEQYHIRYRNNVGIVEVEGRGRKRQEKNENTV